MGLFVASEVVFQERNGQTLELTVASPASYVVILSVRVLMLTLLGLVGVAESWIIARLAFRLALTIYHPSLMFITLVATSLASAGTAVLTAALFSLGRQVRTFQNAVNGPLYLLGGVLVPVTFLPGWMQTVSPFVFFYCPLASCAAPSAPQAKPHRIRVFWRSLPSGQPRGSSVDLFLLACSTSCGEKARWA